VRARILIAFLTAVWTTGCCTAVSSHEWIGHKAPQIMKPEDIADALPHKANPPVTTFDRITGFITTPGKRIGISGWRDLGYDGDVVGTVVQAPVKSNDDFLTVDMKVESITIGGHQITLSDERYLRSEICLREVKLAKNEWPAANQRVEIRGRMMWDGDGFVEIHPRNRGEVSP
jgi:hypothetical protein